MTKSDFDSEDGDISEQERDDEGVDAPLGACANGKYAGKEQENRYFGEESGRFVDD